MHRVGFIVSLVWFAAVTPAFARQQGPPVRSARPPAATPAREDEHLEGPPAPVAPATMTRDAAGRAALRAVRLTAPLKIDGNLDESVYGTVPAISGFYQNEPHEGEPSTERTEVWLFFDAQAVYVCARLWESAEGHRIANEMRRDSPNVVQSDGFGFAFDTFHDRRNSLVFDVNAAGGRIDAQVTNERQVNMDWNPIWNYKVGRFEQGWTVEAAIPFKSLRYQPGSEQVWGFNARRIIRWKNEITYLVPVPAALTMRGHFQSSIMPTVTGIQAPATRRNIEIKPYVTSQLTTDRAVSPAVVNRPAGDIGADAKFSVSRGLTGDLTYNTDFAQVEADEQQVNLTRFSLFFPEKREFFLENQGTFVFGGSSNTTAGSGGGSGGAAGFGAPSASDTPVLFYSRRIGLADAGAIPIAGGGRLTGRAGRYTIGLLNIETARDGASPATNFTVARVRRDILRKSTIGAMFTGRSAAQDGSGHNEAFGLDTTLSFFDNLAINAYWARTHTPDRTGDQTSYRTQLDYSGDRYGVQAERLAIGADFKPDLGFLRRTDIRRTYGQFRFSPRPKGSRRIRRYFSQASLSYIDNSAAQLQARDADAELALEFQSNDRLYVSATDNYELLPSDFTISTGVTLPTGGYHYSNKRAGLNLGGQRRLAGNISVEHGSFYNGDKTTISVARGRVSVTPRLSLEPRVSIDRVHLLQGDFTRKLVSSRVTFTLTPLAFVSALVQYSSAGHQLSSNVRLRWEYRPGSEFFLVWNEQRDTDSLRFPGLMNRALVFKVNRLLRY